MHVIVSASVGVDVRPSIEYVLFDHTRQFVLLSKDVCPLYEVVACLHCTEEGTRKYTAQNCKRVEPSRQIDPLPISEPQRQSHKPDTVHLDIQLQLIYGAQASLIFLGGQIFLHILKLFFPKPRRKLLQRIPRRLVLCLVL